VSVVDLLVLAVANSRRPLLFDDGRLATSLLGIPASPIPPQGPEGSQNILSYFL
jgi:hypothetical protein